MADQQLDLASLVSRIEQLEQEGNLRAKNIQWLKRYLDDLKQEFNTRPELGQLESLQSTVTQLSEQVASLLQLRELVVDTADSYGNLETAEAEYVEQINNPITKEQNITAFSDEGFKVAKMTLLIGAFGDWLILNAYTAELESQREEGVVTAEEFSERSKKGERNFVGINLAGVDLSEKSLPFEADLSQANLNGANLNRVSGAYLYQADLSEANLEKTNLKDANLSGAKLDKVKLTGAIMPNGTTHE